MSSDDDQLVDIESHTSDSPALHSPVYQEEDHSEASHSSQDQPRLPDNLKLDEEIKQAEDQIQRLNAQAVHLSRIGANQDEVDAKLKAAANLKLTLVRVQKRQPSKSLKRQREQDAEGNEDDDKAQGNATIFKNFPLLPVTSAPTAEQLYQYLLTCENFLAARQRLDSRHLAANFLAGVIHHNSLSEHTRRILPANDLTVEQVKKHILQYLGGSNLRSQLAATLQDCKQGTKSIHEYAFAFSNLLAAVGSNETDPLVTERFIDGFNNQTLREEILKVKSLNEGLPIELQRPLSSVRDIAAVAASLDNIIKSAPINKTQRKTTSASQWCKFHKSNTHNTEDCNSLKKRRVDKTDEPDTPSKPHPQQSRENNSHVPRCNYCGKRGHLEKDCYKRKKLGNDDSNNKSQSDTISDLVDDIASLTFLPHPVLFAKQAKTELREALDDPDILAPVVINHKECMAFLDSGASRSFMSKPLFEQLKIKITSPPETIRVEDNLTTESLGTTEPCIVQCGLHLAPVRFTIMNQLNGADVYLGRPELRRLELVVWKLPESDTEHKTNHTYQLEEEIELYEDQYNLDDVHPEDRIKHDELMRELEPLLAINQNITGFAKVPEVKLILLNRQPRWIHQYPIPEAHKQAVRDQIKKWHDKGKIRVGKSLWNLPLTTAIKKDKSGVQTGIRVCIDPRVINKQLITDNFTIPNVREIHNSFKGKKYFGEIDLEDAFLQLKLAAEDVGLLSFTWEGVQYVFEGTPYGVKPISNIFQRTVSSELSDLDFVKVYIDNITIASDTWEEHMRHVKIVIERLNQLNMKLSVKKLKVGRRALRILGKEISAKGIRADPSKVQRILDWPFPANCKALQAFLGVVNYLREHIRHLPDVEAPLNKARVNQESYDREVAHNRDAMEHSFTLLKEAISKAPLLRYPDVDRPFHVAPDASRQGIGAVLYQPTPAQGDVGDTSITSENIVAITSRSLAPYEKNYATFKLETLAVVYALKEFRQFLYGRSFHLHTDHRALTFVLDSGRTKPLHPTLATWVNEILEYDFVITHVPGQLNILPDCLSRLYSQTDAWGVPNTVASALKIRNAAGQPQIAPTEPTLSAFGPNERSYREELMRTLGKRIPEESKRIAIVQHAHKQGHYGIRTVVEKIFNDLNYWWPNMRETVTTELQRCTSCQKYAIHKRGYHPMRTPEVALPGDWWQADLITMPTSENGMSYILTVIDLFSSYLITRAQQTKSAEETATNLHRILCEWGPPRVLQSDGGSEFVNNIVKKVSEIMNIELKVSTPYHKPSTGSIERLNGTLASSLKKMLEGAVTQWDIMLPSVTHFYNTTVRTLSKSSPYAIMFCRAWNHLKNDADITIDDFDLDAWLKDNNFETWVTEHKDRLQSWMAQQKRTLSEIYPSLAELSSNKRQKTAEKFKKTHRIVPQLAVGTRVMLRDPNKTSKHDQTYEGPFTVKSINSTGSYILIDEDGEETRRSISDIKVIPQDKPTLKSYTVERIIKHRGKGDKMEFLVKWKGYSHRDNTWEPINHFEGTKIVSDYLKSKAPERITKKSKRPTTAKHPSTRLASKKAR